MPSVRALACPASLKGVLSAREAAAALAKGLQAWAAVDQLPVADGGEGTLDVLHHALGGEWQEADVSDAFGHRRRARWLGCSPRTVWRSGIPWVEITPRVKRFRVGDVRAWIQAHVRGAP